MSKIYLVTSGEYSDYRIEAAFSTKGKAKEFIKFRAATITQDWAESYRVEKYIVDRPKRLWVNWIIDMKKNGDTDFEDTPYSTTLVSHSHFINYFDGKEGKHVRFSVRGESKQEALKIANEMRQKIIAAGFWWKEEKSRYLIRGEYWDGEEE